MADNEVIVFFNNNYVLYRLSAGGLVFSNEKACWVCFEIVPFRLYREILISFSFVTFGFPSIHVVFFSTRGQCYSCVGCVCIEYTILIYCSLVLLLVFVVLSSPSQSA